MGSRRNGGHRVKKRRTDAAETVFVKSECAFADRCKDMPDAVQTEKNQRFMQKYREKFLLLKELVITLRLGRSADCVSTQEAGASVSQHTPSPGWCHTPPRGEWVGRETRHIEGVYLALCS